MASVALVLSLLAAQTAAVSFEDWLAKYGKSYSSPEELSQRKAIFEATAERVRALNEADGATHELNKFADLSSDEFLNAFTGIKRPTATFPNETLCGYAARGGDGDAPDSFDWRDQDGVVGPIKDQGQCRRRGSPGSSGFIWFSWPCRTSRGGRETNGGPILSRMAGI